MQAQHRPAFSFLWAAAVCAAVLMLTPATVHPAAVQGVTPDATTIPASETPPTVDGTCDSKEYLDAVVRDYVADPTGGTRQVYLKHAGGDLYVCMTGVPGAVPERFFRVYADPEDGREAYASPNDLAFQVGVTTGALSAYRGTGVANGWTAVTVPGWDARATYTPNGESAEFRIPLNLVNDGCQKPSGLAVYHHWVSGVGDDYGWPSNKYFDQPKTWEEVTYGGQSCVTELSIDKADSADPVPAGQQFQYILTVSNNGNSDAIGVGVSDPLPSTLVYDGYSAPAGVACAFTAGAVGCTIASLPSGASVTIELKVHGTAPGYVSNTATVKAPGTDPIPGNNSSTARTEITAPPGKIAYVFRSDDGVATEFKGLLEDNGFTVKLIPLAAVLTTDFAAFDLVIVAHDTGDLNEWPWGSAGPSAEAVHIAAAEKPVVGLGEGGYAYFGKGGKPLGWPNGWHGPLAAVAPANTGAAYWHAPNDFGAPPSPLPLYGAPVAEVGIYLPAAPGTLPLGLEPADKVHAPLIAEEADCNQLWGFAGPPDQMTEAGKKLFVNAATYGIASLGRCVRPPVPPDQCLQVTKSATPPNLTAVQVGDAIEYVLNYSVDASTACNLLRAALEDKIPQDTLFVPGSASDGIAPGADGVLRWDLGPLAPGATGSKSFKVSVVDSACRNQQPIVNQARLATSLGVVISNATKHPVECPPVVPDGTQPPYAEDEIQIYPYPLMAGRVTELSVRIRNLSEIPQTVAVAFEMSPERFGIGLPYGPIPVPGNPRVVVLPPLGSVEVAILWTPATSGHYCVRVKIDNPNDSIPPVYTQRNLDVAENLQPGVQDDLPFAVGNPTGATADILLVVDNTCPGWTAWVTPSRLEDVTPADVRSAILSVVPPATRPLGTACHIDVQGWIGDRLIGGIRKLDVPGVHLPETNPPWMEREIGVVPDPPIIGVPGELCVDLQNPLPLGAGTTVNVTFSVAAFGAGIPFTPVAAPAPVFVPPHSLVRYCISWTPAPVSNDNLHRCIQVRISQPGFVDQLSQRNVDLLRLTTGSLGELLALKIPFSIGNPEAYTQTLRVETRMVGLRRLQGIIDPMPPDIEGLQPIIDPMPPATLLGHEERRFNLGFMQAGAQAAADTAVVGGGGVQVEVAVYLDGKPAGGFSVVLEPPKRIFLPLIMR
jgi:uncharacterized repeat protein (TIGR01451 family)